MRMQFDLDAIRRRIYEKKDVIAADYGLNGSFDEPKKFTDAVVAEMAQSAVSNPAEQEIDNAAVFEAAVKAIWSSGIRWSVVLDRIDQVKKTLHDYDAAKVRDGVDVTELASSLGTRFRIEQAKQLSEWAGRLAETPNFYRDVIAYQAIELRRAAPKEQPSDTELMLALAVLFSEGPTRTTPGRANPSYQFDLKMPGMGIPISCEFLRNLHWPGFKPDVHVTRLLGRWVQACNLPMEQYRNRAEELTHLVGRRGPKHMVEPLQYALLGLDLTPDGTSPSEADNLIWLFGSYVEKKRHETACRYLCP